MNKTIEEVYTDYFGKTTISAKEHIIKFAEAYHTQSLMSHEEPVAYLLRRKDWADGKYEPFIENHSWASESYPLYTSPTEANAELVEYAKKLRDELDTIESLSYIDSVHQCAKEALAISLPTAMKGK